MNWQTIIVFFVFLGALAYLGNRFIVPFFTNDAPKGCASGCQGCQMKEISKKINSAKH